MPSSSLSSPAFAILLSSYRSANILYGELADMTRSRLHPTYHARKRAAGLGLAVDICRAAACPHNQVSVIPLPILDTSPSPTDPVAAGVDDDLYLAPQSRPSLRRRAARRYRSNSRDSPSSEFSSPVAMDISPSSAAPVIPQLLVDDATPAPLHMPTMTRPLPDVPIDVTFGMEDDMFIDESLCDVSSGTSSDSAGLLTPEDVRPPIIRRKRYSSSEANSLHDGAGIKSLKLARKEQLRMQTHPYARR
ncbi:hypothetical protein FISHEDRAFT_73433 [Fistulina hepatica ATCC 64428]|uniref:Uncharacterized protein n=1 Tax=Fistulina hepatica ATCC 64428 TaxID=1128425 RepID=A0A0D7AD69_9AGAR|nr:hypothetical protein FISHEDRAFT_73433 [Fistulina hepatica ATCC 64428]